MLVINRLREFDHKNNGPVDKVGRPSEGCPPYPQATVRNNTMYVKTRQTDYPGVLYKRPRGSEGRRAYPLEEPEQLLER